MKFALAVLLAVMLALSGCAAKARAVTQPEMPSLAPPSPPARVVIPPEPETTEAPPVANQPADTSKRPPRRQPPRPEPAKVDPPKVESAPQPVVPPPPSKPDPPTTLQVTPPGGQAEADAKKLLGQASQDLDRVRPKYQTLTAEGKAQYDTARRFVEQANQAIKEQNYAFALRLADKAATLASGLVGG